ncbi:MAG: hypothetical protein ABIK09_09040 [Pseudomonadota bacterium]
MIRNLLLCVALVLSFTSLACDSGGGSGPACEPGATEIEACEIEPLLECTSTCLDDGSAWGPCEGCPEVHPCDDVDCGGHGACELFGGEAVCNCESGYLPVGLDCKPKDCTPDCTGKDCGSDGCDGSCGACDPTQECVDGSCLCAPDCDGKVCGDDGCGDVCGECGVGQACQAGACVPCEADCWGKECGDDGCGGSCGGCGAGTACQGGTCLCAPDCAGAECGDDGCGGSCGACGFGESCQGGECVACIPNCAGKACGDDGCGGSCGQCGGGMICSGSQCISQGSSCVGSCGGSAPDYCYCDDSCMDYGDCCPDACDACPNLSGCGGGGCGPGEIEDCWGECSPGYSLGDGWCDDAFDCDMFMYDYGDCGGGGSCADMCGGSSGFCYCDDYCFEAGDCCPDICDHCDMFMQCGCEPSCGGKECGSDGCFGSCGSCQPGFGCNPSGMCEEGLCEWEGEIPDCYGVCGPENWVGDGVCDDGGEYGGTDFNCETFAWDGGDCEPCVPTCEGKVCGGDGCGGTCGGCPGGLFCVGYQCTDAYTCGDLYACLITCEDNYNCQDACMSSAPPEAMDQLEEISICLDMAGYFECMDQACVDAAMAQCQYELDACFVGDLDCTGITECMAGCPSGDSGCTTLCYYTGSPEGEDAYDAMIGCVVETCGEEPTAVCWEEALAGACAVQGAACGLEPCEPDCAGVDCGDDGCGGSCGTCDPGFTCEDGACEVCTPACDGLECGDDGCGGVCGECILGSGCADGVCVVLPGAFGFPCASNGDCNSGWCIDDSVDGTMCTIPCTGDCPEGYACEALPPPFPETISICWPVVVGCEFVECDGVCCAEGETCVEGACFMP